MEDNLKIFEDALARELNYYDGLSGSQAGKAFVAYARAVRAAIASMSTRCVSQVGTSTEQVENRIRMLENMISTEKSLTQHYSNIIEDQNLELQRLETECEEAAENTSAAEARADHLWENNEKLRSEIVTLNETVSFWRASAATAGGYMPDNGFVRRPDVEDTGVKFLRDENSELRSKVDNLTKQLQKHEMLNEADERVYAIIDLQRAEAVQECTRLGIELAKERAKFDWFKSQIANGHIVY